MTASCSPAHAIEIARVWKEAISTVMLPMVCSVPLLAPSYLDFHNSLCSFGKFRWATGQSRSEASSRRIWKTRCCQTTVLDEALGTELPCLPFTPAEVFIPSSTKSLHLYEARYLALLDEVMAKYDNMFAHIVMERVGPGEVAGVPGSDLFRTRYGCLAYVESVRRLEIGALIIVRGIGRVSVAELTQHEPFLKGRLVSLTDDVTNDAQSVSSTLEELKKILADVQQLQIRLRVTKNETLETPLVRAMQWAEKNNVKDSARRFLPSKEELISFSALQPVAGASAGELHKLLQERLTAMETKDTMQRLQQSVQYAQQSRASLAAKVALQSLQL